jgi:thiosulfate/3-mercaptopyruvate sulfurtransferase
MLLVDARGRERFRGDVEPIDKVAGHIPGAVNRPYTDNLTADGRFKPARELRSEFSELSAIACHRWSFTPAAQASRPATTCSRWNMRPGGARLYPGSWSEGRLTPARPIARGDS